MSANFWLAMLFGFVIVPQLANLATTVYLHRAITHRALKLGKTVTIIFRILLWITTGIIPKKWAAVHRKHHAHTDEQGDPHSPIIEGFWKIQLFNVYYYAREIRKIDADKYARDVPEWRLLDRFPFANYFGFLVGFSILYLICGWWGIAAGFIHAFVYIFLNALVNGLCHVAGYKTYSNAHAYNLRWVAWITSGEGLHNNHHHGPSNPRLRTGERFGELDLGWLCIKFLRLIGQAEFSPRVEDRLTAGGKSW